MKKSLINMLNRKLIRKGYEELDIGDRVQVKYIGNEDEFPNQLRIGTLMGVLVNKEIPVPELAEYIIQDKQGDIFTSYRLRLEKLT